MRILPVVGYEGLYEVSDTGIVFSCQKNVYDRNGKFRYTRPRKQLKHGWSRKYPQVWLTDSSGKVTGRKVHHLVAKAFIPNPHNLPEVNHDDGDTTNNNFTNLVWSTTLSNIHHALETGLKKSSLCGFKGVTCRKSKTGVDRFRASINLKGKQVRIGTFDTALQAAKAYNDFALANGRSQHLNILP